MDPIKEAFKKVREDIGSLVDEISLIKGEIAFLNNEFDELKQLLTDSSSKRETVFFQQESNKPHNHFDDSTHPSTHNLGFKPLNNQILDISTGSEGVPTDRQTDRQQTLRHRKYQETTLENAEQILNSLDSVKKEIRLKFKKLTEQEWLVFSILYQTEEELGFCDYKSLATKLGLTESSIRDYIGRLIKKGIPVEKNKLNNKNVQLFISENLKKITTLSTLMRLREL
ncbi:MAG: hypothetical protein ABIH49_03505 [archaeon]